MDEGGSYEYDVEVLNYYLHSLFLFGVTMQFYQTLTIPTALCKLSENNTLSKL